MQSRINALRNRRCNLNKQKFKAKPVTVSPRQAYLDRKNQLNKQKKSIKNGSDEETESDESDETETDKTLKTASIRAPAGSTRPQTASDSFNRPLSLNFTRPAHNFPPTHRIGFGPTNNLNSGTGANTNANVSHIPVPGYRASAAKTPPLVTPQTTASTKPGENEGFEMIQVEINNVTTQIDARTGRILRNEASPPWPPMTSDEEDVSSNERKTRTKRVKKAPIRIAATTTNI